MGVDVSMADVLTPEITKTEESLKNFPGKSPAFQNMMLLKDALKTLIVVLKQKRSSAEELYL